MPPACAVPLPASLLNFFSAIAHFATREDINSDALKYINRLSDHLFVLGRHLNDGGRADVLWKPGQNRN